MNYERMSPYGTPNIVDAIFGAKGQMGVKIAKLLEEKLPRKDPTDIDQGIIKVIDLINPNELNGVWLEFKGRSNLIKVEDGCHEYQIFKDRRYVIFIRRYVNEPIEMYCFKKQRP